MKTYEIFKNATGEIVATITGEWAEVQKEVQKNPGTSARAVKPGAHKPVEKVHLPQGCLIIFCDAWTSGNPGIGGYRVVNITHQTLVERNFDTPHSNNFYELSGVGAAIKYATTIDEKEKPVIYTDSKTALAWIREGKCKASADIELLDKAIASIREMLDKNPHISLQKWDTENWGEIPADFGRK